MLTDFVKQALEDSQNKVLTYRQQKLFEHIQKSNNWQLIGSHNKRFKDDLHILWSIGFIEFDETGEYVRPFYGKPNDKIGCI